MNGLILSMFVSTILSGVIATVRDRSVILWTILGVLTGPIAVGLLLFMPSRKAVLPPISIRSLASEIRELEELRERGLLSDDEFAQGKARVLASPLKSEIPPALPPNRALSDSGWTWASYQPATHAAVIDLAHRHCRLRQWRDDVPFEVVCTSRAAEAFLRDHAGARERLDPLPGRRMGFRWHGPGEPGHRPAGRPRGRARSLTRRIRPIARANCLPR
jgi:hypothetical protein